MMRAVDELLEREKPHPDGMNRRVVICGNRFSQEHSRIVIESNV